MKYGTVDDPKWIDGVILRRAARRRWRCAGNGSRSMKIHHPSCTGWVEVGSACAEYVAETASYTSGAHHAMSCAEQWLVKTPSASCVDRRC